ncbi:MAG: hypothetical protein LBM04_13700, partial [Opitutaceae bacterium]|nr:hypothetical protein [Opitutaceae bacterium]
MLKNIVIQKRPWFQILCLRLRVRAHLKNGTGHAANSGVERASRPLTAKLPDRVARASCPWTARSAAPPHASPDAGETPALLPERGQDARAT